MVREDASRVLGKHATMAQDNLESRRNNKPRSTGIATNIRMDSLRGIGNEK
jgi:hypothetical protein